MKFEKNKGYFAYADFQYIYVFESQGKKDITYIDCSTFKHRTIANTKLPIHKNEGIGVRVGARFLMVGGHWYDKTGGVHWNEGPFLSEPYFDNAYLLSWSIKRKMYLEVNQWFKTAQTEYTCLAALNRTHFLIVNTPPSNGDVTLVNIENWRETSLPRIPLPVLPNPLDFSYTTDYNNALKNADQSRVTCSIEFNKNYNMVLTLLSKKICYVDNIQQECFNPFESLNTMYQFDFKTMTWSNSTTNIHYFGSLIILNGIKHFISIPNEENILGYYYNPKNKTWLELNRPQLDFKDDKKLNDPSKWPEYSIVLTPYYAPLK